MPHLDRLIYTARVRTTGGRDGASRSSDGRLDVQLSPPGAPGTGTNPEQLLAAGWSACFIGAMRRAAAGLKVTLPPDLAVVAEVDLGMAGEGHLLQARLDISLPGLARGVAREVARAAHRICPYSKAMRGNIEVAVSVA